MLRVVRALALPLLLLSALIPSASAQGAPDTKRLADDLVRRIVELQDRQTWLWGGSLDTTARVLDLLLRSPRRYNEVDGPFFRRAAHAVADVDPGPGPHDAATLESEARRVLALASAVTDELLLARAEARERLAAQPDQALGYHALLVRRSLPVEGEPALPEPDADTEPGRAVLLAEDPARVAPPSVEDPTAWTRWARASRLRGRLPSVHPDLPAPADDAALPELLAALDLVLAVHGLEARSGGPEGPPPPSVSPHVRTPRPREEALATALDWLDREQDDGTFGLGAAVDPRPEPGITALCLAAAIHTADELGRERPEWVASGLDYLVGLQKPDGSIYEYGVRVYTTSVAMEALLAGGREADRPVIERALGFLKELQADEGEGYEREQDPHYGGIGYGGDERPDLSNTQMALEAAHRAGLPSDDPLFQKALLFLERNQNLPEGEARSWPRAEGGTIVPGSDGGATYMPGNSPAGEEQVGEDLYVARSYGSMTHALLKSYLFCGLPADDARVQAALGWIARNYRFDRNPGFTDARKAGDGLYYYYVAMGRALDRAAPDGLVTEDGLRLDWRRDLQDALRLRQRQDGSWVNELSERWYEGNPALCTAYALLALEATR